jgi:hypothetical protein
VTAAGRGPLRVALLHHGYGSGAAATPERLVHELARALRGAGHAPAVLSSRVGPTRRFENDATPVVQVARLPETLLQRRGFDGPLTHAPATVMELARGRYQVAHAFSPQDAAAAHAWRGLGGGPAVYTCAEPLTRELLANRRLRLPLLARAVEESDAVVAPTEESGAALRRWLAVEALVIPAGDAGAHERLYRELLERRT